MRQFPASRYALTSSSIQEGSIGPCEDFDWEWSNRAAMSKLSCAELSDVLRPLKGSGARARPEWLDAIRARFGAYARLRINGSGSMAQDQDQWLRISGSGSVADAGSGYEALRGCGGEGRGVAELIEICTASGIDCI